MSLRVDNIHPNMTSWFSDRRRSHSSLPEHLQCCVLWQVSFWAAADADPSLTVLHKLLSQGSVAKCPRTIHVVASRGHSRNCLSRCFWRFQNKVYYALLGFVILSFPQNHAQHLISNLSVCDDNLVPSTACFMVLGAVCVCERQRASYEALVIYHSFQGNLKYSPLRLSPQNNCYTC